MYPFTLNLTRDECRGMLRRLELESYSNVISTFRAQGTLSDNKIKLLEDLRNAFHISQDRHRAEARRVAKDEQLSTIAEMIYGPNTHQEWQKEGRRSFPLFPRAPPLTALAVIANGVAKTASEENSKLPYPSDTAELRKHEDLPVSKDKNIVQRDPILVAEEERKNLKRSLSLAEHLALSFPSSKKRTISGESIPSNSQTHIHTNAKIQQLYHNHSKTQSRHRKSSSKKNVPNTSRKGNISQGKTSQPKILKTPELPVSEGKSHVPNARILHSYANVPPQKAISSSLITELDPYGANKLPQIATSKKDITNNLSKLNLSQISQQMHLQNSYIPENEHKVDKGGINAQRLVADDSNHVMGTHLSGTEIVYSTKVNASPMSSGRCNVKPLVIGTKYQIKPKPPEYQSTQSSPLVTVIDPTNHDGGRSNAPHPPPTITVIGRPESDFMSPKVTTTEVTGSTVDLSPGGELHKLTTVPVILSSGEIQTHTVSKAQIQSVVTKPKIQITSQQILTPALSNIKLPIGVQIKGVPANRKNVKILSSGKMILQTLDNSKTITRLGTVVTSKNLTGASVITPVSPGRPVTVQKLHLVQNPNNKSISISKPNMIIMPATVGSTSGGGTAFFKSVPIVKNAKLQAVEKPTSDTNFGGITKGQNNVFVIGAIPSEKLPARDNEISFSNSEMITEDTPVDILPPPMSNVETIESSSMNSISRDVEPYEIKPSVVRSLSLNSNDDLRKTTGKDLQVVLNSSETAGVVELRLQDNKVKNSETRQDFVVGTTDWELELDFEAKKVRNTAEKRTELNTIAADTIDNDNGDMIGISDDNFHDVIEEETVEEDEGTISDNAGTMDGTLEYHITCGSGSEEIDENVTIEYVEDSRSHLYEEEGEEVICKEKFRNAYETIESDGFTNRTPRKDDGKEAFNNNIRRMQISRIQNGIFKRKNQESSGVMYEMQNTDEKGLMQAKNINRLSSENMQV